jgi:hypothetical protein
MAPAIPFISIGLGALGTIGSGMSQKSAGDAEQAAYYYNARMVLRKTMEEREASREEFANLMGRQRSLYAKAGVDMNSGSPLLVYMDTALKAARESQRLKRAGEEEAGLLRMQGAAAAKAGRTARNWTFLTGLGKAGIDTYSAIKAQG